MLTRPGILLKIEFAVLFAATVLLYHHFHFSWLLFAILFLTPDPFMLGYLADTRTGPAIYNLGHIVVLPLVLFAAAYFAHHTILLAVAIIWLSHIAFDRMLAFGLKYPTAFKDTHLQHIP